MQFFFFFKSTPSSWANPPGTVTRQTNVANDAKANPKKSPGNPCSQVGNSTVDSRTRHATRRATFCKPRVRSPRGSRPWALVVSFLFFLLFFSFVFLPFVFFFFFFDFPRGGLCGLSGVLQLHRWDFTGKVGMGWGGGMRGGLIGTVDVYTAKSTAYIPMYRP